MAAEGIPCREKRGCAADPARQKVCGQGSPSNLGRSVELPAGGPRVGRLAFRRGWGLARLPGG